MYEVGDKFIFLGNCPYRCCFMRGSIVSIVEHDNDYLRLHNDEILVQGEFLFPPSRIINQTTTVNCLLPLKGITELEKLLYDVNPTF